MKCIQCGTEFDSPFCPRCGAPAQAAPQQVPQQVPQAPAKPPKKKRPIYRRWWFILLAILAAFILLVEVTSIKPKVKWDELVLGEMLPPMEGRGEIHQNSMTDLSLRIEKVTAKEFVAYVEECKQMGFTKEGQFSADFCAVNDKGYELTLFHYENEEELSLSLREPYEPEEDEDTEPEDTPTTTTTTKKADSAALGKDFKSFMDSYEKFMGEYVDFMKKYQANPTDMSLIADYSKIMNQYNQFVKDFNAWGDKDLSAAEVAYYTKVQGRVSQKLLEVAAG